jgi:hypothetical protein
MQCFVCGEQMRVVLVEPHHLIDMPGFELRTFQCVGCGDVEKRPYFDSEGPRREPVPVSEPSAPEAEASTPAAASEAAPDPSEVSEVIAAQAPGNRMKSIFGGIAKLRTKPGEQ